MWSMRSHLPSYLMVPRPRRKRSICRGSKAGSSRRKTGLSGVSLKSPPAIILSMPKAASESARKRSRSTAIRRRGSDSAAPPYLDGWWFTSTATFAESRLNTHNRISRVAMTVSAANRWQGLESRSSRRDERYNRATSIPRRSGESK